MVRKDTGEFIGDCGMTMQQIDGEWLPEIGYHVSKKYWRQGFGSEAARAVRDWAFLEWAAAYDTAGVEMRSFAKHDAWEKLLRCPILRLDGAKPLEENFAMVCNALMGGERK